MHSNDVFISIGNEEKTAPKLGEYLLRYIVHELVFVGKQRKIKLKILSISSHK